MAAEQLERLKIAYVFDGCLDDADGVPAYIKTLDAYYSELGHRVSYIVGESRTNDPRVMSLGRSATIHINGNDVNVPLSTSREVVREAISETDPDIVHIQMPYSPLLGGRVVNQTTEEMGVIGTFHILPNSRSVSMLTRALRLATVSSRHRIDHSVSASPVVQSFAESAFGVESTILPCPIDTKRFKQGKRLPEYNDGKTNLLFMGRLVERKGCQHLIEALGELNNVGNLDNLRILIAGEGPLKDRLVGRARSLRIDKITEFVGFVEEKDKPNVLASADIAIFPATGGESFGIVLVEAMAARALVIGGNNPGYKSILSEFPEALFDPKETKVFAQKLGTFISNEKLRQEIRTRQQEKLSQYDVNTVGAKMLEIYCHVLEQKRK